MENILDLLPVFVNVYNNFINFYGPAPLVLKALTILFFIIMVMSTYGFFASMAVVILYGSIVVLKLAYTMQLVQAASVFVVLSIVMVVLLTMAIITRYVLLLVSCEIKNEWARDIFNLLTLSAHS